MTGLRKLPVQQLCVTTRNMVAARLRDEAARIECGHEYFISRLASPPDHH